MRARVRECVYHRKYRDTTRLCVYIEPHVCVCIYISHVCVIYRKRAGESARERARESEGKRESKSLSERARARERERERERERV